MNVSVVITHKDRPDLLKRAIDTIRQQPNGKDVEIVVVDDFSSQENLSILKYFKIDKLVENNLNMGAPYSRNLGIKSAAKRIIHLMDCDDFVVELDYLSIEKEIMGTGSLYYAQVHSQGSLVKYPDEIQASDFIDSVVKKYKHICQTSSLFFDKFTMHIRFDENLPKHQDWDFVYSCLRDGICVKKIKGVVFFDRSDRKSLSRSINYKKSLPWLDKIKEDKNYEFIRFYLLGSNKTEYSNILFLKNITLFFFGRKIIAIDCLKLIYKRFFC
jgi:glycosyltransferase involved in cell wall biosynthesis